MENNSNSIPNMQNLHSIFPQLDPEKLSKSAMVQIYQQIAEAASSINAIVLQDSIDSQSFTALESASFLPPHSSTVVPVRSTDKATKSESDSAMSAPPDSNQDALMIESTGKSLAKAAKAAAPRRLRSESTATRKKNASTKSNDSGGIKKTGRGPKKQIKVTSNETSEDVNELVTSHKPILEKCPVCGLKFEDVTVHRDAVHGKSNK